MDARSSVAYYLKCSAKHCGVPLSGIDHNHIPPAGMEHALLPPLTLSIRSSKRSPKSR
jgi:hypothetical protein